MAIAVRGQSYSVPAPYVTRKYYVDIEEIRSASFMQCTGLSLTMQPDTVKEGGLNSYIHQLPTRYDVGKIKLVYGILFGDKIWSWFNDVLNGTIKRKEVSIYLYENTVEAPGGSPSMTWHLHSAFPIAYQGPGLDASKSEIAVDTITLACEGMTRQDNSGGTTITVFGLG